ncbi:MAG: FxLYD domain-containing protein [Acidobacteriota bacterium]|nr:FxLYD domain-containing protein [Acidobacteriota bacterium]
MRYIAGFLCCTILAAVPAVAVDFLGVELCVGSHDTAVVLPVGSPLSLESSEIGRYGGLLLLFKAENGDIMDHIDNLMAAYTDTRGTGDSKKLQWTGNQITGYAQLIKKGYAALAVSTTDDCQAGATAAATEVGDEISSTETAGAIKEIVEEPTVESAAIAVAAATVAAEEVDAAIETEDVIAAAVATEEEAVVPVSTEEPETPADFLLKGRLKHTGAEDGWVDVMGVVVNNSGENYSVASFDLSLYDGTGDLICVDTISVNQLRDGQERAFRSAIRCPDYDAAAVASWKLQFGGAH